MKFLKYDLGHQSGGAMVEVTLSAQANVRLMDSSNFQSYRRGGQHRYFGGLAKRSPVRLQIPHSGTWHVVIDMGGHAGTVRAGVRVLPGQLPPIQERPLSSVPSLVRSKFEDIVPAPDSDTGQVYDVFICHASEDKDAVARPLAHALVGKGLSVWYDEFTLKIGDSLRRKIDRGLASSRFGVVILSQAFFQKGWPNYELDGIVTRVATGEQVLLPVWHKVSKDEVIGYSPSLADKVARNTGTYTVDEIAHEIAEVIESS